MGYYTDYNLEVKVDPLKHSFEELDAAVQATNSYLESFIKINDADPTFVWGCSDTWHDHEEDMAKLSAQFPDLLFKLRGTGENSGDLWMKYFKGGLVQRAPAQITFDEFDEGKLVPTSMEEE